MSWTKIEATEEPKDVTVEVEGVEWKLQASEKNNAEVMTASVMTPRDLARKVAEGRLKDRKV